MASHQSPSRHLSCPTVPSHAAPHGGELPPGPGSRPRPAAEPGAAPAAGGAPWGGKGKGSAGRRHRSPTCPPSAAGEVSDEAAAGSGWRGAAGGVCLLPVPVSLML